MKRSTWMKLVVGALVSGCALFTACGDDSDATPAPADGGNDGTVTGDTGTPPDQDGGDGAPLSDQASPGDDAEAGGRMDAAKPDSEANCVSVDKCDCDNDGYRSGSLACKPDAGDAGVDAANTDCDDLDPDVFPGPNRSFFTDKDPPRMGDVNCNGTVEKQYNVNLACGVALPCAGEGFLNDPPCGTSATYYKCGGLALCGPQAVGTRTQGCR